jgi:flagellar motor switch protein FliG
MDPIEYDKMSRVQKIAAFLIVIGPDAAAEVMNRFDNAQLEVICKEMVALPLISSAVQRDLMRELALVVSDGIGAALGGLAFTQAALEKAKGSYAASSILSRCEPGERSDASEAIRQMEGRQVINLIKSEQPQTIALIVSCMDMPQAAEVVQMLPQELREQVVEKLAGLEPTSRESIHKVARNLNRHFDQRAIQQGLHRGGGIKACADLLNALDKDTRKTLLTRLEERNAPLGAAIRKKVFSFEDLSRLTPMDLQRVMRDVSSADLPIALKTAKATVQDAVLGSLSKRAAEGLREEMEMLASPRSKEVEAAQDRIIQVVRKLEEAEEITINETPSEERAFT